MDCEQNLSDEFLEVLLRSYYKENKAYDEAIINFEIIAKAVTIFETYFDTRDQLQLGKHSEFIKKIFVCDDSFMGISPKTLQRYREKYLDVFRKFLVQVLQNFKKAN